MKRVYTTAQSRLLPKMPRCSCTRRGRTQLACRSAAADLDNRGVCCRRSQRSQTPSVCLAFPERCASAISMARTRSGSLPIDGCYEDTIPFPRFWCEGVIAQLRGDKAAARAAFTSARAERAKFVAGQPTYAEALCVLGMADAALGYKDDAIREGRRAAELLPVSKDAISGPLLIQYLGVIYAWTGEKDLALEQLSVAASFPVFELRSFTSASVLGSVARRPAL